MSLMSRLSTRTEYSLEWFFGIPDIGTLVPPPPPRDLLLSLSWPPSTPIKTLRLAAGCWITETAHASRGISGGRIPRLIYVSRIIIVVTVIFARSTVREDWFLTHGTTVNLKADCTWVPPNVRRSLRFIFLGLFPSAVISFSIATTIFISLRQLICCKND